MSAERMMNDFSDAKMSLPISVLFEGRGPSPGSEGLHRMCHSALRDLRFRLGPQMLQLTLPSVIQRARAEHAVVYHRLISSFLFLVKSSSHFFEAFCLCW